MGKQNGIARMPRGRPLNLGCFCSLLQPALTRAAANSTSFAQWSLLPPLTLRTLRALSHSGGPELPPSLVHPNTPGSLLIAQ
ncbi:hypothetical protein CI238_09039 [Colletotrichum incanum]|uniref:Uncharacterized protein n=1 Tax=Colletotrichum incanum TaxID=1573173 RepID=A0A167AZ64_COLIC|nr:hypothetical protein CI238_09039 [Colletotrichum incanum]